MDTLFERIGGASAVNAAVDTYYDSRRSNDSDSRQLARRQKQFLTYAFGGAPAGHWLRTAQPRLLVDMGLGDEHFDDVLDNLGLTLKKRGVPTHLISEAAAIAESTRIDILDN